MTVKILRNHKLLKGGIGQEIECDPAIGNHLACLGYVSITQHDPASGPSAKVTRSKKESKKDDVQ